jgi:hypothetical protein
MITGYYSKEELKKAESVLDEVKNNLWSEQLS